MLQVLPISVVSILRFLIMLGEEYNACSSTLCNFLHYPVISSLLAPNIFLSTLFSNTLNLCSCLNVRGQVSQPFNTTGNTYNSFICLNFQFLGKVADRGYALQKWRVAASMLNKQSWTADRGGPPAWGLVERLTTPHRKKRDCYEYFK